MVKKKVKLKGKTLLVAKENFGQLLCVSISGMLLSHATKQGTNERVGDPKWAKDCQFFHCSW